MRSPDCKCSKLDKSAEVALKRMGDEAGMDQSSTNKRGPSMSPHTGGRRASPYAARKEKDEEEQPKSVFAAGEAGKFFGDGGTARSSDSAKGGKGGGKGGKGKGEGAGEIDNTTDGILRTHSKIISRLSQDKREEARRVQWVFEIGTETRLVRALEEAGQAWANTRKGLGKGQRMEYEKHEKQWGIFLQYTREAIKNFQDNGGEKKTARHIENWLDLGWSEDESEKQASVQTFRMVGRLGRSRAENNPTLWIVRYRNDTQKCRELYEETIRCRKDLEKVLLITIRRDTGPKDYNERALEAHMEPLNPLNKNLGQNWQKAEF